MTNAIRSALLLALFIFCDRAVARPAASLDDFQPPQDGYSWVQLTSGEWLKGEIMSLYEDVLRFDSDVLDELDIDWEDVRAIRAVGRYEVGFEDSSVVRGELVVNRTSIVLQDGDKRRTFPRSRLVSIAASAQREIDRWDADIGFGLNVRRGNSSVLESNIDAGFKRRTALSRTAGSYLGSYNETEGIEIAQSHRATLTIDRLLRNRLYWRIASLQYYQDPFQNLRHQAKLESGLGYDLFSSDKSEWEINGAVGASYIRYISVAEGEPAEEVSPSATIGTTFETELTSWIDYDFELRTTFLNEKSGKYQHHLMTKLSTDLIGDVDMDVSFIWDRTQNPQPREDDTIPKRDDYRLIFGLSYEF